MKPRDYCCCAIPMVNAGIYTALTEQLVLGITAGVLAVATDPSMYSRNWLQIWALLICVILVVGAATPSFAKWIFAIVCFVAAAVQFLGFMGVSSVCPSTLLLG